MAVASPAKSTVSPGVQATPALNKPAAGAAPAGTQTAVAIPDARLAKIYQQQCATCHGAKGDGAGPRAYFINPKPRNFTEVQWRDRTNRVALFAAVSEGRLASEMPAWNKVATPQQIADVAEYVFQSFVQPGPAAMAAKR